MAQAISVEALAYRSCRILLLDVIGVDDERAGEKSLELAFHLY
jgi:hypothetical protein